MTGSWKTFPASSSFCAATKNAGSIIVMRDGVIKAEGAPAELDSSNEYYKLFSKTL